MGLPVSQQFNPNPHQLLTAKELVHRVKCVEQSDSDADYNGEVQFWIGAKWGGEYDYGGVFKWSRQPDTSKPIKKMFKTIDYEDKYVLIYTPKGSNCGKHAAESISVIVFTTRQKEHIAYWDKDLQQWILANRMTIK